MVPLTPPRSTRTMTQALTLYDSGYEALQQPDGCFARGTAPWARPSEQDSSLAQLFDLLVCTHVLYVRRERAESAAMARAPALMDKDRRSPVVGCRRFRSPGSPVESTMSIFVSINEYGPIYGAP